LEPSRADNLFHRSLEDTDLDRKIALAFDPTHLLGWAGQVEERADSTQPPSDPETLSERSIDAARDRILDRFETWLDEVLAEEEPPSGMAAEFLALLDGDEEVEDLLEEESQNDLFSMWSTITALTQEVRIQGRTFKQLNDTVAPIVDRSLSLEPVLEAYDETMSEVRRVVDEVKSIGQERKREIERGAEHKAVNDLLEVLLDVYDRLLRGLDATREHLDRATSVSRKRWWRRLFRRRASREEHAIDATRALEEGYALGVSRLRDVLDRLGVHPIEREGTPFDPRLMNAVEIEETDSVPEGTVLEVHRAGYTWNGDVFRPSQVKVARAPLSRANDA
jgi:molecular chaperone GrpE